jgi:hypothetical protein
MNGATTKLAMTNQPASLAFLPSREVRVIPGGWQHPRDERGRHVPLLPAGYVFDDDQDSTTACMPDVAGLPASATEIAAYETVSEGTPISPEFPNTDAGRLGLVNYCAEHAMTFGEHKADAEAWAAVLFGGAVVDERGAVSARG